MRASVVRFGAFADAHFAAKVYGDRHCADSADKLQACVDIFGRAGLDFAICMGDLIDSSEDLEEEKGYVRKMRDIFGRFEGTRHWVLGNHDLSGLSKEAFLELCGAERPAYYSFDVKGAHFVVLDGNCVTSRGPGTALEFALQLVEQLFGKARRDAVAQPMVIA